MRSTGSKQESKGRRWHSAGEVAAILECYHQSGLTQQAFAREAGIGASTLQLWLRRARGAAPLSLIEVEVDGGAVPGTGFAVRYEVTLPGGVRLRLGADFEDGQLRRLLGLLREGR